MSKRAVPARTPSEVVLEARNLNAAEVRLIVANYYAAQAMRKRLDMQIRHYGDKDAVGGQDALPAPIFLEMSAKFWADQEKFALTMLREYAQARKVGQWLLAQHGVGPVIAAGCLAHLDITKAATAGNFQSFSGLNPDKMSWSKGEKRPYNPDMKQVMFHFGECVKRAGEHPDNYYGLIYRLKKAKKEAANERGEFTERAEAFTLKSQDGPAAKALKAGKLPAFNIDAQATRHAAKIFLSHLHAVMYWDHYGRTPPRPFAIQHLGHGHELKVPLTEEIFPGFVDAYYGSQQKKAA